METEKNPQVKQPLVMEEPQIDQPPVVLDRPDWVVDRPPVGEHTDATEEPLLAEWPNEEVAASDDAPPITEAPVAAPIVPTEEQAKEEAVAAKKEAAAAEKAADKPAPKGDVARP